MYMAGALDTDLVLHQIKSFALDSRVQWEEKCTNQNAGVDNETCECPRHKSSDKSFVITTLSRADINGLRDTNDDALFDIDASALTDDDMERIARKMGELYVASSFFDDLAIIAAPYLKAKN